MARSAFDLIYDSAVHRHLAAIERKHHGLIRREIEKGLRHEPDVETQNRKPLLRPSALESVYELRFGPENKYRVFYKIEHDLNRVYILSIGVKDREKLKVGWEVIEL